MKIFLLEDVEIKIYKSHLAKKITISIRPTGTIRVTIPRYVSYLDAERFVLQKKDWIFSNLKKIEEHSKIDESVPTSGYVTKKHKLVLIQQDKAGITVRVQNGVVLVKHNKLISQNSTEVRKAINKGILAALKKEAVEFLPQRLLELSLKHKLSYTNISIKKMRTRWGSCTGRNKINMNTHLMILPNHLIDYVLLHELAHTKVKNHGRNYWAALEGLCPNSKKFDKELKTYKILNV